MGAHRMSHGVCAALHNVPGRVPPTPASSNADEPPISGEEDSLMTTQKFDSTLTNDQFDVVAGGAAYSKFHGDSGATSRRGDVSNAFSLKHEEIKVTYTEINPHFIVHSNFRPRR